MLTGLEMISQTTEDKGRLFLVSQLPTCMYVWETSADNSVLVQLLKPLPGVFSSNCSDSEDSTVALEDSSLRVTLGLNDWELSNSKGAFSL